jgi:hypothetical protein
VTAPAATFPPASARQDLFGQARARAGHADDENRFADGSPSPAWRRRKSASKAAAKLRMHASVVA